MILLDYEGERIFNKILILGLCDCPDNGGTEIKINRESLKSHITQLMPYLEKGEKVLLPLFVRLKPYSLSKSNNYDSLNKIKSFKSGYTDKGARCLVFFTNKRVLIGHEETQFIFIKKWYFEEISYENMDIEDGVGIYLQTNKGCFEICRHGGRDYFSFETKWQNIIWVDKITIESKIKCIIYERIFNSPEFEEVTDENHEEYFRIRDILRKYGSYITIHNKEARARRYYYQVLSKSQREELRLKIIKKYPSEFRKYYRVPEEFVPDIMIEDLPDYFDL